MDPTPAPPKLSIEVIKERRRTMEHWVKEACGFARELDWLGLPERHAEGSDERALAEVRDTVDLYLTRTLGTLMANIQVRALTTHSSDLLVDTLMRRTGDGADALRLMRRYYALHGDECEPDGEPCAESFPSMFLWDTYLRVSELPDLFAQYPKHLRDSARQMHGWPMIVSHHLDHRAEFEMVAEELELGTEYPLDVRPRKRRGAETPLLRHLEPMVWRLHVLHGTLLSTEARDGQKDFCERLKWSWWDPFDPKPSPEVQAILKQLTALPPLNQKTAGEWSRKVIVPLIMHDDAKDRETCTVEALQNIWRHRAVKSRATFKSRLHSAVTDTLKRFARPEEG